MSKEEPELALQEQMFKNIDTANVMLAIIADHLGLGDQVHAALDRMDKIYADRAGVEGKSSTNS